MQLEDAAGGDRGRDGRRIGATRVLLDVAPEVRLDLQDDGPGSSRSVLETLT